MNRIKFAPEFRVVVFDLIIVASQRLRMFFGLSSCDIKNALNVHKNILLQGKQRKKQEKETLDLIFCLLTL